MKLSIITINYNNASGLKKTMESVLSQTSTDFEYIIVDGASSDTSTQMISDKGLVINGNTEHSGIRVTCISESDNGIYQAMNKGIRMAKGEYVQFLNSGDVLAALDVAERMIEKLGVLSSESEVDILYGNMLKPYKGKILRDKGFAGRQPTMLDFYRGTLNHSPAYIGRSLFEKYGLYDETLKIVSDWKWYMQAIIWGGEKIQYFDIDVTVFDMTGISETNKDLDASERDFVLKSILPEKVIIDYNKWSFSISQIERIKHYYWAEKLFYLFERILFMWEKRNNK